MSATATRVFEVVTSVIDQPTALIIGVAGETGSGKTLSSIRLAVGMCKVVGGKPVLIDTNSRRGLHYRKSDRNPKGFDYNYIDFEPPFAPGAYIDAIQAAVATGSKVVIVDSMSDEHSGDGGIMDQINALLDDKCGSDFSKRERMNMVAHARIKPQRAQLNRYIVQLGRKGVILILCYRAHDKVKPITGQGIKHVGFDPETTSTLRYEMTQAFLLMPGAKGQPTVTPETNEEKIWSKTPMQFEGWMKGSQLDEAMGERLARWAVGSTVISQDKPIKTDDAHGFNSGVAGGVPLADGPGHPAAPSTEVPKCPACLKPMNFVGSINTKPAFWACPDFKAGCKSTMKDSEWKEVLSQASNSDFRDADDSIGVI